MQVRVFDVLRPKSGYIPSTPQCNETTHVLQTQLAAVQAVIVGYEFTSLKT